MHSGPFGASTNNIVAFQSFRSSSFDRSELFNVRMSPLVPGVCSPAGEPFWRAWHSESSDARSPVCKALVTRSDALVTSSLLLVAMPGALFVRHLLLEAMHLLLVACY